jgi:hypothetical protein
MRQSVRRIVQNEAVGAENEAKCTKDRTKQGCWSGKRGKVYEGLYKMPRRFAGGSPAGLEAGRGMRVV